MDIKKVRAALCILSFILVLYFLWNNILTLDDFHPAHVEIIQAALEDNTASIPPKNKKGWHIHINLDEVKMYVYKDGELIKTYPVSGGKSSTPTPLGTWKIISKDRWGEGFGGAWMGFNVPWGKYGIHGTVYPWVIGKSNTSKGCIRMKNKDVKELYKMVPYGTTVTIVYNNRPFRTLKNGNVGSDVLEVQKALQKLGYYQSGLDGKFGAALTSAVKNFQRDNRLRMSGIVNRQTYDLIMQKLQQLQQPQH